MREDGKVYGCPRHGFALNSKFTLVEQTENNLKYRLVSSLTSKEIYPYYSKMLCIEPWQNLPDTKGENAEFNDKDGVIKVAPFSKKKITRNIKYN